MKKVKIPCPFRCDLFSTVYSLSSDINKKFVDSNCTAIFFMKGSRKTVYRPHIPANCCPDHHHHQHHTSCIITLGDKRRYFRLTLGSRTSISKKFRKRNNKSEEVKKSRQNIKNSIDKAF